jgi:hypothetical protein
MMSNDGRACRLTVSATDTQQIRITCHDHGPIALYDGGAMFGRLVADGAAHLLGVRDAELADSEPPW